ncbi:nitroreductase family protein [Lentisphaera profundi]|uniref:nitroreductase family protein n=1 Tax=Lentisphaera profundi TaxID=1658616 RepID=UPI003B66B382
MKSCALAAQNLMLAATEMGYDSTPMGDYSHSQLAEIVRLPDNHIITMCIAIGEKVKSAPPRPGEMDYNDVIYYNRFT